jgi:ribulose 1,5-bisphosphate synthetase/thiazole synthase
MKQRTYIITKRIVRLLLQVEDLIVKKDSTGNQRIAGVVTNWTLVSLNHDTQSWYVNLLDLSHYIQSHANTLKQKTVWTPTPSRLQ